MNKCLTQDLFPVVDCFDHRLSSKTLKWEHLPSDDHSPDIIWSFREHSNLRAMHQYTGNELC